MQSARRPLTRDASGPGFRSVEPHRFRSAAQPTTATAATAAAAAIDLPLPSPIRRTSRRIHGESTIEISVPASRHRNNTHRRFIHPPSTDNRVEWFSWSSFQKENRAAPRSLCRSTIERLMCICICMYVYIPDEIDRPTSRHDRCYMG